METNATTKTYTISYSNGRPDVDGLTYEEALACLRATYPRLAVTRDLEDRTVCWETPADMDEQGMGDPGIRAVASIEPEAGPMSAPAYRGWCVEGQILEGNMFHETAGLNVHASVERYREMLTQALVARYPGVAIDLTILWDTQGIGRPLTMIGPDGLPDDEQAPWLHDLAARVHDGGEWAVNA